MLSRHWILRRERERNERKFRHGTRPGQEKGCKEVEEGIQNEEVPEEVKRQIRLLRWDAKQRLVLCIIFTILAAVAVALLK